MSNIVSTDPLADMLSRIRNAMAVRKHEVTLPYSKLKSAVAEVLKSSKYIDDVKASGEGIEKSLTVTINQPQQNARITSIKMVSTPGRRQYVTASEIPTVMHGRGMVIISTSKGMMTGDAARKAGVGGELLCEVY